MTAIGKRSADAEEVFVLTRATTSSGAKSYYQRLGDCSVIVDNETDQTLDFRVTLPGPGGELRFAVGSPDGPRSAMWKLWATKNKSDVYLAYRAMGRYWKVSLHQSGDWRMQWASPEVARQVSSNDGSRLINWWRRPEAVDGWTVGPMIVVTERDLVPLAFDEPVEGVVWFPNPDPGHAVWLHVLIVEPGSPGKSFSNVAPGGGFELANGEVCVLLARQRPLSVEDLNWLEQQRHESEVVQGVVVEAGEVYARMLTCLSNQTRPPLFFDLAVRAPEADR